ncbi:MAG: hypothetical protein MnENMB40S_38770 [Rhizobiaceae bacterium MnEN-MB40S]|nr:MAG: hypothetical protein MnENMB40S_38770 [Rhizobiaceae bacterium MnEN-MB40S]
MKKRNKKICLKEVSQEGLTKCYSVSVDEKIVGEISLFSHLIPKMNTQDDEYSLVYAGMDLCIIGQKIVCYEEEQEILYAKIFGEFILVIAETYISLKKIEDFIEIKRIDHDEVFINFINSSDDDIYLKDIQSREFIFNKNDFTFSKTE